METTAKIAIAGVLLFLLARQKSSAAPSSPVSPALESIAPDGYNPYNSLSAPIVGNPFSEPKTNPPVVPPLAPATHPSGSYLLAGQFPALGQNRFGLFIDAVNRIKALVVPYFGNPTGYSNAIAAKSLLSSNTPEGAYARSLAPHGLIGTRGGGPGSSFAETHGLTPGQFFSNFNTSVNIALGQPGSFLGTSNPFGQSSGTRYYLR